MAIEINKRFSSGRVDGCLSKIEDEGSKRGSFDRYCGDYYYITLSIL